MACRRSDSTICAIHPRRAAAAEGVHPKVVRVRPGIALIAMTLDIYSRILPSMGREAAAKLESALSLNQVVNSNHTSGEGMGTTLKP
jgi:hypothetical protein